MTLDDNPATDFKSDATMPNIWTIDDNTQNDSDDDTSSRSNDYSNRDNRSYDEPKHDVVLSADVDEELEKPSFLRRLAKRVKDNSESDKTDKND
ncbi:MAG: hypothetical protein ABWX94_01710, partial [Candidatus Saccharimonadales bacterium]